MKGLCFSTFRRIYLHLWSNQLQAAENWLEFETALSVHIIHFLNIFYSSEAHTHNQWKYSTSAQTKCHLWGITWAGLCCLIQAMCTHRSTPATLGSSSLKCHWYFTAELHKNCEIYSTSASPLKLPMPLLSLRQLPFMVHCGSTAAMP